jgi:O-antigen/teichoic acid export membrane protein
MTFINQGVISIADQGFFSGTNFVFSLLLGRWLIADDYGVFSVASSIFLLFSGIFSALILEPLSVYGAKKQNQEIGYFSSVILLHVLLSLTVVTIFSFSTLFIRELQSVTIRIMVLCAPFILLFWLVRRRDYSNLRPSASLIKSIIFSIGTIGLLILFYQAKTLNSSSYFLIVAGMSVMISIPVLLNTGKPKIVLIIEVAGKHWGYGKWIALAGLLQWSSSQIYTIWVASYISLSDSAGFRAIQNFSQPLEQITTALSLFLIPWFSNKINVQNQKKMLNQMSIVSLLMGILGIGYLGLIILNQDQILSYVYQNRYADYSWLFPILLCVPIVLSLSQGAQIGIRIMEKTNILLIPYAISSLFTFFIGPTMIFKFGLLGAATGRLISAVLFSLTLSILYVISIKKDKHYGQKVEI